MQPKNFTLQKKLRNYSLLAGAVFAASGTAKAQIIYHSLNLSLDVITGMNHSLAIDLNGDGTTDLDIGYDHHSISNGVIYLDFGKSTGTHPWNRNVAVAGSVATLIGQPNPYSTGAKIGASNKWFGYQALEASAGANYVRPFIAENIGGEGKWGGLTGKFLAVRLTSGGHYYYGWVRLSIATNETKITIVDDAYQSSPDSSINAGETTTGISTHSLQNISVYSSGKNVFVKYPGASDGISIIVRDMIGKEVKAVQTTNELYEMNLTNAASGIYTVSVRSKEAEITKKVSIQ